jgi:hypothetical protein
MRKDVDWICLRIESGGGFCERGNESCDSIKGWEVLDWLNDC